MKGEAGSTDLNKEPREVKRERVTRSRGKSGVEETGQQMDRRVLRSMYRTLQDRIKGIDYILDSNVQLFYLFVIIIIIIVFWLQIREMI